MKTATPESDIRILKVGSCTSLTSKSTLSYQVGCNAESEIQFRVYANTGGGYFSKEWVSLNAIRQVLENHPKDKSFSSLILRQLFQGKSTNTPAFLMAVLKAEGLVNSVDDKTKHYELMSFDKFTDDIKKLMDSAIDLNNVSEPIDLKVKRGRKPKSSLEQGS